ncbi:hypothetical protein LJB81_01375 [Desulfovibrio sp. OttesenSCG-928-M14]|nr:hypothetical protein [Desulfovibrio sp. OttesenSCG-928-M14]
MAPMEAVEYVAVALVVLGVWHIGRMNVLGQYLMAAAQILWIVVGVACGLRGLTLQSLVLFTLTLRAIHLWRKDKKERS